MEDATPTLQQPISTLSEGAVERMISALGIPLLEFVLNAPVDSVSNGTALAESMTAAKEIDEFLLTEHEGVSSPEAWAEVLKGQLTDTKLPGGPWALTFRSRCGGMDTMPTGEDEAERLLVGIARRVYPSMLLPVDPHLQNWGLGGRPSISSALFRDPDSKLFQDQVMLDPIFKKAYPHKTKESGPIGMIYCSTGRGGSMQLWMLADQILQAAWTQPTPTLSDFAQRVVEQYRFIRAAFDGQEQTVQSRLSFAGALLPGSKLFSFGDITLRGATQRDLELAPESLSGQLGTTDEQGVHTLINYAGDVVAEVDIPYLVKITKEKLGDAPREFPQDILARNPLEAIGTRLQASLLLALQRSYRVQIVLSWQITDDPLSHGPIMSWSNKESFAGLLAAQLTGEEVTAWQDWYKLLSTSGAERIQLAISRVVRAAAERRDPVDVLIDSVIAWENLFGTKDGEPTLRVTASLALLLEPDTKKRRNFRTKLGKIYGLRSNAVHGTALPRPSEISLCYDALDVSIQALRAILKDRPGLLAEGDGGVRSLKLILGEELSGSSVLRK